MKQTTLVIGSMRKGNSAYISKKIADTFQNVNSFTLGNNIKYCTGCLECDETHKCNIRDDMDSILESLYCSDLLIIVTPVRYSLMSGDVKVFIDRLNPTAVSEDLCGKNVLAIAIGQTEESDGTITEALTSIEMFVNNANMKYVGGFPVYSCYDNNDLSKKDDIVDEIIKWIRERI